MRLGDVPPGERQAIKKDWVQYLNASNQRYGRCKKLIAGSKEPTEGTVLGQFGTKVAEIIGHLGNAMYIAHCCEEACCGLVSQGG
jgi:hypothetical protein